MTRISKAQPAHYLSHRRTRIVAWLAILAALVVALRVTAYFDWMASAFIVMIVAALALVAYRSA